MISHPTLTQAADVAPVFADIRNGCDCHAHMIGAATAFPFDPARPEDPPPGSFEHWLDRYRAHLQGLGLTRGVIVHSLLYGLDNAITAATVQRLGRDNFRGVGLVSGDISEIGLGRMAEAGFVGVRLNYVHGGVLNWQGAARLAPRLRAHGMHLQILLNARDHMSEIAPRIADLDVDVVVDHMGWPEIEAGPAEKGFTELLRLLGRGDVWLKLSGVYRLCNPPFDAADSFARAAIDANPQRVIWGSDWPFLMLGTARRPQTRSLAAALLRVAPDRGQRQLILGDNPQRLFGFDP